MINFTNIGVVYYYNIILYIDISDQIDKTVH